MSDYQYKSMTQLTGTGTVTRFTLPFPVPKKYGSTLSVYIDGEEVTASPVYKPTMINDTTVEFAITPPNGSSILLARNTMDDTSIVRAVSNAPVTSTQFNNNCTQILYILQEVHDELHLMWIQLMEIINELNEKLDDIDSRVSALEAWRIELEKQLISIMENMQDLIDRAEDAALIAEIAAEEAQDVLQAVSDLLANFEMPIATTLKYGAVILGNDTQMASGDPNCVPTMAQVRYEVDDAKQHATTASYGIVRLLDSVSVNNIMSMEDTDAKANDVVRAADFKRIILTSQLFAIYDFGSGGTADSPETIGVGDKFSVTLPQVGYCLLIPQVRQIIRDDNGVETLTDWFDPKWCVSNIADSMGVSAVQENNTVIVRAGTHSVCAHGAMSGSPHEYLSPITDRLQVRLLCSGFAAGKHEIELSAHIISGVPYFLVRTIDV